MSKRKQNGGYSLIEVLIAITVLGIIVVPICSSLITSFRMNAKTESILQAQLAVSSAVETLMSEGITEDSDDYKKDDDRFKRVTVKTEEPTEPTESIPPESSESEESGAAEASESAEGATPEPSEPAGGTSEGAPAYYVVTVTDKDNLVTITTQIRAVKAGEGAGTK